MYSENTVQIIVVGENNVTSFGSDQHRERAQLIILGYADLKMDEIVGTIQMQKIPSSKPIII